jgi:hypothetical protein
MLATDDVGTAGSRKAALTSRAGRLEQAGDSDSAPANGENARLHPPASVSSAGAHAPLSDVRALSTVR